MYDSVSGGSCSIDKAARFATAEHWSSVIESATHTHACSALSAWQVLHLRQRLLEFGGQNFTLLYAMYLALNTSRSETTQGNPWQTNHACTFPRNTFLPYAMFIHLSSACMDSVVLSLQSTYEDKDSVHLVMEVCGGGELFDSIVESGNFSEKKAAQVSDQIHNLQGCCDVYTTAGISCCKTKDGLYCSSICMRTQTAVVHDYRII
jgi:hypothetical protein